MDERIDIALRDIGVSRCVMFGVEKAGFSYGFVIAKQPFHPSPCLRCARNAAARAWRKRALRVCALQYPCPPAVSSNPGFYGKGLKKWVRPAGGADRNQTRKISRNS